ncbi:TetR-like C-terminal domain-containing protein [Robertmurraya sp. DFI.2.37]|uniref:TetR/AcrR family transcriptional regulator n=1 Tax=Robertmurraya sp. DFI.2.37 TaxID=3031819 RepID=UPI00124825A7|nr:TetR-like C-terminal domain-containing protein [Robertmurraya sp. DFI.2.37]MDF1507936.1 TetR-like C-terminal domain-containing protein [Robertmurraya sp. DFI.2.37]
MNAKLDRRKKYTRMALKDGLIKLLQEKPISAITVKEICGIADINRSTFYSHYLDHYDLLNKIEEEIIEDMAGYLNECTYEKDEDDLLLIERLLEYFHSKHEVCTTLLNENMDTTFQKKVTIFAHQSFMKNWRASHTLDKEIADYVSTFIISGSIDVIRKWLNNGMDKPPKEMAEVISTLIKKGFSGLL